jgi:hypothetical protein
MDALDYQPTYDTHYVPIFDSFEEEWRNVCDSTDLWYADSSRLGILQSVDDDEKTLSLKLTGDTDDNTKYTQTPKKPKSLLFLKKGTFETSGIVDIECAVSYFFKYASICRSLIIRATDIFKIVAKMQNDQKQRTVQTPRTSQQYKCRKRYGRQKAFVISSIIIGMKQLGLNIDPLTNTKLSRDKQNIEELNRVVSGETLITISSVKKCCRELGFTSIRLS